jgi:hypothetical protein
MTESPVYCKVAVTNSDKLIFTSGLYGKAGSDSEAQVNAMFTELDALMKSAGSDLRRRECEAQCAPAEVLQPEASPRRFEGECDGSRRRRLHNHTRHDRRAAEEVTASFLPPSPGDARTDGAIPLSARFRPLVEWLHEQTDGTPHRKARLMVASNNGKFGPLFWAGMFLWIFGVTFAAVKTFNHFEQQPREPLGLDLTLRYGDGGFIAYGVAAAILGFVLILINSRKNAGRIRP